MSPRRQSDFGHPWVKLPTTFSHVEVGNAEAGLYARALAHCGAHLTDGFVAVSFLNSRRERALANALVEAGLWEPTEGGWLVVGYLDVQRQKSRAEVEKFRLEAALRQQQHRDKQRALQRDDPATSQRDNGDRSQRDGPECHTVRSSSPSSSSSSSVRVTDQNHLSGRTLSPEERAEENLWWRDGIPPNGMTAAEAEKKHGPPLPPGTARKTPADFSEKPVDLIVEAVRRFGNPVSEVRPLRSSVSSGFPDA